MMRPWRTFPLIFFLLFILACAGPASTPSPAVAKVHLLKSRIAEIFTDDDRRAGMLEAADRMEKQVRKLEGLNRSTRNKIFKIYLKKETAQEDFNKILKEHQKKRLKIVNDMIILRIQMKQAASKVEWDLLAKGEEFAR
jgi:hypothetical protein